MYIHLRMGLYICLYMYVRMHMYVSIHNYMSVCERCMWNKGCIETLPIWHICISKNMRVLKFVFFFITIMLT